MVRRFHVDAGDMALALILWLCSLPLVALLVVPFFGPKGGAIVAAALLFVALAICWGACGWKAYQSLTRVGRRDKGEASSGAADDPPATPGATRPNDGARAGHPRPAP